MNPIRLTLGVAALSLAITASAELGDPLAKGFLNPPDSAKPQTWWHWMNGNITKAGITADLEAMKQIGLGGATIVNVDCDIPAGPVKFMSPAWREDFKFAMQEASRLGLDMTVENCAGWSSSGGPWNTPENAMQQVVSSEVSLTGPTNFSGVLPVPPAKLGYYRDIAVLACRVSAADDVSMADLAPVATTSSGSDAAKAIDGDYQTSIRLPAPAPRQPQFVQVEFKQPFGARTVKIIGGAAMPECSGEVLVSADGLVFRSVKKFTFGHRNTGTQLLSLGNELVSARFWRIQFNEASGRENAKTIPLAEISLEARLSVADLGRKTTMIGGVGVGQTEIIADLNASTSPAGAAQRGEMLDLTSRLTADGKLDWQAPAGHWVLLRIGYTPTGALNHPAPSEGTGLECDKFSKGALDKHWDGFMGKVLDDIGPLAGKTLTTSLIDSYEVGGQNWTKNFREEFQRRRGYDLLTYLPAMTGRIVDNPAATERFLWDLRRTIADLFAENYFGHFAELCRQHGLQNAVEPYTGPFESMQSGAPADVVMGEFWSGSAGHASVKLASSIAHIYGKTIVGAESFTATPQNGKWMNDPYSLKPLGDLMFAQGLNRYIFHRYAMQPWTNHWPGMTMGQWGFHFERTETWWHQGKPWIDYISRCEFLLQQGRAVNDAAYFTGESAPVEMRLGNPKLPAGYDFDAINADVLLHGATVKNGRLTLASGANYAALILPEKDRDLTPQLLARLAELVRAGATVVGAPPQRSPSLAGYPACDAEVKKLAVEMWGDCDGKNVLEHAYGQGCVVWGKPMSEVFAAQKLSPDFEFASADTKTKLACGHRVAGAAEIYFVSNQRTQSATADCTFRVSGKTPELWHAETGVIERAPVWHEQDGRTTVRLTFGPADSVFVIFRAKATLLNQVVSVNMDPQWQALSFGKGALMVRATSDGTAKFETVEGKIFKATAVGIPAAQAVSGAWQLNFPPNWGAPASVTLDNLISWPEQTNAGVKYFSGTATYEKEIEISADRLAGGRELWLDLGAVKNFAEISLNGQNLGILWKPPFRVNVTAAAKPGANKLVVKVTNLWPNRLIGDEQLPPDVEWNGKQLKEWPQWFLAGQPSPTGRLTFTTWHHWKKDDALLESGLLGPVTLQTAEIIPAR